MKELTIEVANGTIFIPYDFGGLEADGQEKIRCMIECLGYRWEDSVAFRHPSKEIVLKFWILRMKFGTGL